MKRVEYVLVILLFCLSVCGLGCPSHDLVYPVLVQERTFGFQPKWWDKTVEYARVVVREDSEEPNQAESFGLIGSCRGASNRELESFGPYRTVWAVRATAPVLARDFSLVPGLVPDQFEQAIPETPEVFVPIDGQLYYIMTCLAPLDDKSLSFAVPWIPGQEVPLPDMDEATKTEGPFRHAPSGMVFPGRVGVFSRGRIQSYDPEGRDVGVGYDLSSHTEPVSVTVYVYPMPPAEMKGAEAPSFDDVFKAAAREIEMLHSTATRVTQQPVTHRYGDNVCPGRMATYDYDGSFAGFRGAIRTHLYLFGPLDGTWLIKYRITHPKDVDASERIEEFIGQWTWTIGDS